MVPCNYKGNLEQETARKIHVPVSNEFANANSDRVRDVCTLRATEISKTAMRILIEQFFPPCATPISKRGYPDHSPRSPGCM